MHDDFECFAGIDWATEAHQVCLVDRAGVILGEHHDAPRPEIWEKTSGHHT